MCPAQRVTASFLSRSKLSVIVPGWWLPALAGIENREVEISGGHESLNDWPPVIADYFYDLEGWDSRGLHVESSRMLDPTFQILLFDLLKRLWGFVLMSDLSPSFDVDVQPHDLPSSFRAWCSLGRSPETLWRSFQRSSLLVTIPLCSRPPSSRRKQTLPRLPGAQELQL